VLVVMVRRSRNYLPRLLLLLEWACILSGLDHNVDKDRSVLHAPAREGETERTYISTDTGVAVGQLPIVLKGTLRVLRGSPENTPNAE